METGFRRLATLAALALPWHASAQGAGDVLSERPIHCNELGGTNLLSSGDAFGSAVVAIGDLDQDGQIDMAVGAPEEDIGGASNGAVWVLFLKPDGSVKREGILGSSSGGFGGLLTGDRFGSALASVDDLDGDGLRELVVGAPQDDDGGTNRGCVWVLFLNRSGNVRFERKISSNTPNGPLLANGDRFGAAIAPLGDLDGDGLDEIAVGAPEALSGSARTGTVWILFPASDGSVRTSLRLDGGTQGLLAGLRAGDRFGSSLSPVGDLDGDGINELAVGAGGDDDAAPDAGAVWLLFLDPTGSVRDTRKLGPGLALDAADGFGSALACPGDLDGDGRVELAVGAPGDDDGASNAGALWVLFLTPDGLLRGWNKVGALTPSLQFPISANDGFGSALGGLGELDRGGSLELVVGAPGHDECFSNAGEARILFLDGIAAVALRNGTGVNRQRLVGGRPPRMGEDWEVLVDCRDKEHGIVVHLVTDRPAGGRVLAMGEILIDLSRPRLARAQANHRMTIATLTHAVPQDPALLGLSVYSQALVSGVGGLELTNALDSQVVP